MKDFKKSDLRNRMVVETRNGHLYLVVDQIFMGIGGFNYLSSYNNNLTIKGELREYDIMKIYPELNQFYSVNNPIVIYKKPIWERKEEVVKEISIEELEKHYGCKVKIVKEK